MSEVAFESLPPLKVFHEVLGLDGTLTLHPPAEAYAIRSGMDYRVAVHDIFSKSLRLRLRGVPSPEGHCTIAFPGFPNDADVHSYVAPTWLACLQWYMPVAHLGICLVPLMKRSQYPVSFIIQELTGRKLEFTTSWSFAKTVSDLLEDYNVIIIDHLVGFGKAETYTSPRDFRKNHVGSPFFRRHFPDE